MVQEIRPPFSPDVELEFTMRTRTTLWVISVVTLGLIGSAALAATTTPTRKPDKPAATAAAEVQPLQQAYALLELADHDYRVGRGREYLDARARR